MVVFSGKKVNSVLNEVLRTKSQCEKQLALFFARRAPTASEASPWVENKPEVHEHGHSCGHTPLLMSI